MNILNLAIDQESTEIVLHLSEILNKDQIKSLVTHRYGKGMQAIHQAISLGELCMITTLTEKMGANINTKMHNNLSSMHCAAQTY